MNITRVKHKETGKERFLNEHLFTTKGAEYWKSEGYEVDPKPYVREVAPKGVKYTLDTEAWETELDAHNRADEANKEKEAPKTRKLKAKDVDAEPENEA